MNYIAKPIGTIHTPFKTTEGMPIQPTGANGIKGTIELNEEFLKGIKDLDGFSHIILLYYFHLFMKNNDDDKKYKLTVTPFIFLIVII
ncbi:MAG: SAM-dependent methyltransferase, partial [Calditrichia bacterium]|nr:SAM-dependent methyltransferase [Calditrichia bacterium]